MRFSNRSLTAVLVALMFLAVYLIIQTPQWFFFTSSKERVDFNKSLGVYDQAATQGYFDKKFVHVPRFDLVSSVYSHVLGESAFNKRIEVDLTNQRLYAFEGDRKVFDFLISSGKFSSTPTGEFQIWIKLRYVRMHGGNKALGTYYDLPNVPYTMFFYNDQVPKWKGYGLHGTYWHSNFGHPMSHGCVNMKTEDAEKLYYWVYPALGERSSALATNENPGTRVIIYGTTPAS